MAYLGQTAHESTLANRVTNTMTGDGSDTTLTLSSAPISVNNVLVFIDGVMQRPTTDYTVSGTTLTFAAAPHNSAKVQAIIGGGEHIGVPLAPITEDQLVDGVVTSAKLESGIQIPASKITSLAASKITGALPVLAGGNLTGMSPTTVGIDNVTTNPSPTTNPSGGVGTIHLNKTTGEMFVCTNATTNANVWFNVGEGSGDISNATPTNPTSTNSFPDITESSSQTFIFSGATDADGSVTHYMADQFSNAALSVSAAEVAATTAHTFNTGAVGSDTAVTFRVRSKDDKGAYSSGVTVSMNVTNTVYTIATGGAVNGGTVSGDYKYHVFNSTGTFTVSQVGTDATIDYLVVAGGGSGNNGNPGGAGGAGGFRTTTGTSGRNSAAESKPTISATSYTMTVGAGGAYAAGGTNNYSRPGNNSTISGLSITSNGGGYSGMLSNIASQSGGPGGCGGGAGTYYGRNAGTGGTGMAGQGFDGGDANNVGFATGGGGGAGAAGQSASNGSIAAGGVGLANSITGSSVYYSGGGGGGRYPGSATSPGGNGGGGAGSVDGGTATAGTSNTGGGGGGGGWLGAAGGSGIIIVRYKFQN